MTFTFHEMAAQAAHDGLISDEEIADLRRAGWANGTITPGEADAIFSLNNALENPTPAWSDFFVEAMCEFLMRREEPRGYVTKTQADWLMSKVMHDNHVESMTELELLVTLTEKAHNVPDELKQFILSELEHAVMTGTGPTRSGGALSDSHVSEAEVAMMRRTLFGMASERPAAIGRNEAEFLFRIKDATLKARNARGWKRLFVQGVGNYLMAYSSANAQISRERAADLNEFMNDRSSHLAGFLGRMAKAVPNSAGVVFGKKSSEPTLAEKLAAEAEITVSEQDWLDAQVEANGEIDEYDRALLHFLAGGDPPAA